MTAKRVSEIDSDWDKFCENLNNYDYLITTHRHLVIRLGRIGVEKDAKLGYNIAKCVMDDFTKWRLEQLINA